jgi:hypothetical protein
METPEALRLAGQLELMGYWAAGDTVRRLHEKNQDLCKALHNISLASQDSGSTREGMGVYARSVLLQTKEQHDN